MIENAVCSSKSA